MLAVAIIAVVIVVVINSGKKNKTAGTVDVVTETTTAQSVTQTGCASDTATLSSDEEKQEDPRMRQTWECQISRYVWRKHSIPCLTTRQTWPSEWIYH